MKCIILIFIALSLAFCSSDPIGQGNLFTEEGQNSLKSSYLGRVILRLVSLKSKVQQFDFSKLFDALDELDVQLKERITEEQASFKEYAVQYSVDVNFFQLQITETQNDVSTHQVDIEDLQNTRTSLEQTLTTKQEELKNAQNLRASVESNISKNQQTFDAQIGEYNEAINALDQALELVGQARDGSFVEFSHAEIVGAHMEKKMSNLQHRRVMFKPLIDSFLSLASNNFSDQDSLTKIIKLLQELRDNLNNSRISLTNQFQSQFQANKDLVENYNQLIESLTNLVIPQLQDDIEGKVGEIVSKKTLLSDATSNLKAAQENLEATENRWLSRQKSNTDLITEYNNQLVVVAQAVNHLQRAGIKRP